MSQPATIPRRSAPGWRMTPDQQALFWRLWAAACANQGWHRLPTAQREQKRREILAGLGFTSAKEINDTDGFDRVKDRLQQLCDVVSDDPPDAGERRRILWLINSTLSRLRQSGYPDHSIATILKTRFKVIEGLTTFDGLPTHELLSLLRKLNSRLNTWKKRKPQTGTDAGARNQFRSPSADTLPQACIGHAEPFF